MQPSVRCRHCEINKAVRPRGLCAVCYYLPGVRERYDRDICNRRGVGVSGYQLPLPTPTTAAPGSEAKVQELMRRAEGGRQLWHPDDWCGDD